MDLRLLRCFVAVAEELHFGRAAQRLFIAQPSLSASIRKLEREVGTALLDRGRHGVSLTAAGEAMLGPARAVIAGAEALPALARLAATPDGSLDVGYVPYARSTVLPDLLAGFREVAPRASVTVRAGSDSPEVFSDLRDGRIDVGILRAPVSAPWLGCVTLAVEPFHVGLPAGHRLSHAAVVELKDLAEDTFALFPRELNPAAHDHLMTFFAQAGYRPKIGQASRRMDESLLFVVGGYGVGVFPQSVAETTREPGVVFTPLVNPTPTVEIVLGWDVHTLNPHVSALVAMAEKRLVPAAPPAQSNER